MAQPKGRRRATRTATASLSNQTTELVVAIGGGTHATTRVRRIRKINAKGDREMKWVIKRIKNEPVMFQAVIQAGLMMSISFGTALSTEQVSGILAFSGAVLALLTRTRTNPVCTDDPETCEESEPAGSHQTAT